MSIKSALRDDLAVSYGMISILVIGSLRSPPPLSGCAIGHAFGVRVHRVQFLTLIVPPLAGERWWRQPPKGAEATGLQRFLRWTGLMAGGFLSLTAFQAEGCGLPLRAMLIKSALRIYLSVSYVMISILRIGSLRSPPPFRLRRTFSPPSGRERINRSMLSCRDMAPWLSIHSAPACGGKGTGFARSRRRLRIK